MRVGLLNSGFVVQASVLARREDGELIELSKGGMTKDSSFSTASIPKRYTRAMVFHLIDRGELRYGTRLAEVLPDTARRLPYGGIVTIRRMAGP